MIDLHIHTTHSSDGQYTAKEIISLAGGCGMTMLAFSDHMDICAAEEGLELIKDTGMEFFTGVELSASWKGREYHLLCYGFNPADTVLKDFIHTTCSRIWSSMDTIIEYFKDLGFMLQKDDISGWGKSVPTGVTMLNALLAGNPDDERLRRYTHGDRSNSPYLNFYQDFSLSDFGKTISSGLPCLKDTVRLLKGCGVLVLAHPGQISEEILREMKGWGIEGIEVYSTHHGPDTITHLCTLAASLGLSVSAGSDFHGEKIKPGISLGMAAGEPDEALIRAIRRKMAGWRS